MTVHDAAREMMTELREPPRVQDQTYFWNVMAYEAARSTRRTAA